MCSVKNKIIYFIHLNTLSNGFCVSTIHLYLNEILQYLSFKI